MLSLCEISMPYLGLITCVPVEVIDQSELQESLLAISKMTAEELAAYSKVQSLLGKIAKTPEEITMPSNPHHSFNRVQQNRGPNSYPTVTRPYIPSIHEIKKANNNFQPPINLQSYDNHPTSSYTNYMTSLSLCINYETRCHRRTDRDRPTDGRCPV